MEDQENNEKYSCPCCGQKTLSEEPPGTFDICVICFWEDDPVQFKDPDYEGGANRVSLNQARNNFLEFGACDELAIAQRAYYEDWLKNPTEELILR